MGAGAPSAFAGRRERIEHGRRGLAGGAWQMMQLQSGKWEARAHQVLAQSP